MYASKQMPFCSFFISFTGRCGCCAVVLCVLLTIFCIRTMQQLLLVLAIREKKTVKIVLKAYKPSLAPVLQ